MSLRSVIRRAQLLKTTNVAAAVLEIPDEPKLYSIRVSLGTRQLPESFFRCKQMRSILRSFFPVYWTHPVVVILRFFCAPPSNVKLSAKALKDEKTPALFAYEINEYILSTLEMLHRVLFNNYKQIVKIDAEKFYSKRPRTELQFMTWEQYVELQNRGALYPAPKSFGAPIEVGCVQSEPEGNA